MKNEELFTGRGEIVIFNPDERVRLDVRIEGETVWLTQAQMGELFGVRRQAITKHLKNLFKEGELEENSVCSILEHTATDGKQYSTMFYSLDAILSVGYRVNSKNATLFRRWANTVLKIIFFVDMRSTEGWKIWRSAQLQMKRRLIFLCVCHFRRWKEYSSRGRYSTPMFSCRT